MGTAKIWFYPDPNGPVVEIDIDEALSDNQVHQKVDQSVSEGLTGSIDTAQYSSRAVLRLIDERFVDAARARKIYLLRDHLQAGGLCSIAEDSDKAVAGFVATVPVLSGSVGIVSLVGRPWPYNGSATLASGDEVEFLGNQPRALRQLVTVSSFSAGDILVTGEVLSYDFAAQGARWVLVRHRGFWPVLRLPKENRNASVITDDHRISYTLDVELEEAIDAIESFAHEPTVGVTTTSPTTGQGTLEAHNNPFAGGPGLPTNAPWWNP